VILPSHLKTRIQGYPQVVSCLIADPRNKLLIKRKGFREEALSFSCRLKILVSYDCHFINQVLGTTQFLYDEQSISNIQTDSSLHRWQEGKI